MADPKNPSSNKDAEIKKAPKARAPRATAAVDALALYPLPPDDVDEKKVEVLSECSYGDQTVRVVTDGKNLWKEVA